MLGVPKRIFLDKLIRRAHDPAAGAVILLHQQYFGSAVFLLKVQERLRIRRAEPVNALVLISDHEEIVIAGREQRNDRVLDLRGVLRLVHTDVAVNVLKMSQHLRHLAQDRQRVHHLVVIVHQVLLAQPAVVLLIDLPDVDLTIRVPQRAPFAAPKLADLLFGQHLVFDIGDQRPHIAKIRLRGPGLLHLLIDLCQNTGRLLLIRHQLKCFLPQHAAVIADDLSADPVDCPKFQT